MEPSLPIHSSFDTISINSEPEIFHNSANEPKPPIILEQTNDNNITSNTTLGRTTPTR
ncbi:unnamed protein product [Sphenostylis stenocarpa]|uniref:Uncharacterized protein n=1 Tax=Sphenostylis stenocarpa TaxID=92480 RepID=A0AA86VIU5_9FABA|nr:unnamed protein product [Sphenostylis stenocarpa]